MFDEDADVGDMKVSFKKFHKIHQSASEARQRVESGRLEELSGTELIDLYDSLHAAQCLNAQESGPDMAFVTDYSESLGKLRKEIGTRVPKNKS